MIGLGQSGANFLRLNLCEIAYMVQFVIILGSVGCSLCWAFVEVMD